MSTERQLRSLHLAIEKGDLDVVKVWLKELDVNAVHDDRTAVQVAARRGTPEIYNCVFAVPDADFMVTTSTNYSLLHLACERMDDNVDLVHLLIDRGLDPNQRETRRKETPLMVALRRWRPRVCSALIVHEKTDLKVVDVRDECPLFRAAQLGSGELVKLMLDGGRVNVEQRNTNKYTPLLAAINPWGDCDIDFASELRRVALKEVKGNYVDVVQALLAGGADPRVYDAHAKCAAVHAALVGGPEVLRCLLDAGVNPNKMTLDKPLGHVIVDDDDTHYEELGVLIQHPSFDPKVLYQEQSLIDAIIKSAANTAKAHKADRFHGNRYVGGEFRYEVFINHLIEIGCPFINAREGNALLVSAIELGRVSLVNMFLARRDTLNDVIEKKTGNTALHVAVWREMPDIAKALILGGASREVCNEKKLRPIDILEFSSSRSEELLEVFLTTPPLDDITEFTKAALLDRCVQYSRLKGVEMLLKQGASLRCPGYPSPLYTWVVSIIERETLPERLDRHRSIGRLLLSHPEASLNRVISRTGNEVVPILAAIDCGNTIFLRQLLDHGSDICMKDKTGNDALHHALRFEDRRVRLQVTRVLVGRGFHLNPQRRMLISWINRNTSHLITCPWSLFRLVVISLITSLVLPGVWYRLKHNAQAMLTVVADEAAHVGRQLVPPSALPHPSVMAALEKLDKMSRSLFLVDLARDAVRRQLVTVTKERVLRLPLPPALHSHLLLETTFEDMPRDELGVELETLHLRPICDSTQSDGGVEDWPAIKLLSARQG